METESKERGARKWTLIVDGVKQGRHSWKNYGGWTRPNYDSWSVRSVVVGSKSYIVDGTRADGYTIAHDHTEKTITITTA